MDALMQFRCRAVRHQDPAVLRAQVSPITLHQRLWAYCPLGVDESHEWEKLEGGRSFEELKRKSFSEARIGQSW